MSVVEIWLMLVAVGAAVGVLTSIRSVCLEAEVGTKRVTCRKKIRWLELGDVVPKSGIAMMAAGVVWLVSGIREVLAQRGIRFTELEAVLEYHLVWASFLAVATGVTLLTLYLITRPLRE